mmetsp:Transcript_31338/g.61880  ORF Transcript_31338/g.61880 Transcript_31338/m.61880 type:complete len:122 (-) Transcript_31338:309-674(-)
MPQAKEGRTVKVQKKGAQQTSILGFLKFSTGSQSEQGRQQEEGQRPKLKACECCCGFHFENFDTDLWKRCFKAEKDFLLMKDFAPPPPAFSAARSTVTAEHPPTPLDVQNSTEAVEGPFHR